MQWFVSNVNHPFDQLVVMILAKTGIGVSELVSLELSDIYLRDGGLGLTSTVERRTRPFFLLPESEKGPGSGNGKRLCDTLVPIGPELRKCLRRYLAVRPDTESAKLLISTGEAWGKPISHDIIHHTVEKNARTVGLYDTGAGADSNLTPTAFRQFFANRYQGQPAVRDYLLGKKEKTPFNQGQIATDYRESIFNLFH
nr:tyrosine-type recombinase/integrase [Salinadaptatus halalkaliphilus]